MPIYIAHNGRLYRLCVVRDLKAKSFKFARTVASRFYVNYFLSINIQTASGIEATNFGLATQPALRIAIVGVSFLFHFRFAN